MTKGEFIEALREKLSGIAAEDAQTILDYYAEMIDDRMEDGMSEQEAVASVGSPEDIAAGMLNGGENDQNEIQNIYIKAINSDISILPSDGGMRIATACRAVVRNRTLIIEQKSRRDSDDTCIYLPRGSYSGLHISCPSGDVSIAGGLSFENAEIIGKSGDIEFAAEIRKAIAVQTISGDIELKNTNGGSMTLTAVSGEVTVYSAQNTANVKIATVSGDIELIGVIASGSVKLESASGDVTMRGCDGGAIMINTLSGDVEAELLSGKAFTVRTGSGEVDVPLSTVGGRCAVTTGSGDITVRVVRRYCSTN